MTRLSFQAGLANRIIIGRAVHTLVVLYTNLYAKVNFISSSSCFHRHRLCHCYLYRIKLDAESISVQTSMDFSSFRTLPIIMRDITIVLR